MTEDLRLAKHYDIDSSQSVCIIVILDKEKVSGMSDDPVSLPVVPYRMNTCTELNFAT